MMISGSYPLMVRRIVTCTTSMTASAHTRSTASPISVLFSESLLLLFRFLLSAKAHPLPTHPKLLLSFLLFCLLRSFCALSRLPPIRRDLALPLHQIRDHHCGKHRHDHDHNDNRYDPSYFFIIKIHESLSFLSYSTVQADGFPVLFLHAAPASVTAPIL